MEPGTGKSKVTIDTAAFLRLSGKISGMVIIAPSGVHSAWIIDQVPTHMPDPVPWRAFEWSSPRASTQRFQKAWREFINPTDSFPILAINIEAVLTEGGFKALKFFLQRFKCLMVVDESTDIRTPGAKRTKRIRALGRLAPYRRILSGFPDPESPLDLYAQLAFLSPHIVGSNVASFKATYAEYEHVFYHGKNRPAVPVLKGFRNLDQLQRIVSQHCFRVTKDILGLPPKVYARRYFEMSREQQRMYDELREDWVTEFNDGAEVTAELTIVRLTRLQQIASGYVPTDAATEDAEPERVIPGPQPRLEQLRDVIDKTPGKMIVWVRYRIDADIIMDAMGRGPGQHAVRFDGAVDKSTRKENLEKWQKGDARILVASPAAGGRGYTLVEGKSVVYYSHYRGFEPRFQSEDRCHRIGQQHSVLYTDLVARGTVDEVILKSYVEKEDVGRLVLGDLRKGRFPL
jgi:SNF2 family DNA or RNA helicase